MTMTYRQFLCCIMTVSALFGIAIAKNQQKINKDMFSAIEHEHELRLPPPNIKASNVTVLDNVYAGGTVYTSEIDPSKTVITSKGVEVVPNPSGTTQFSGHIAVNPKKKLLVNEINPVKQVVVFDTTGKKAQLAYVEDDTRATCFSGDVAVNPKRKLLVNEINPVKEGCLPDDACNSATKFSGNIWVRDVHTWGQIDPVLNVSSQTVLRLRFANTIPLIKGAYLKLHFIASSNGNTPYDVFYTEDFYLNKTCQISLTPPANKSCVNQTLLTNSPVQCSFSTNTSASFFDIFVLMSINTTITDLLYNGCLHYEIIACEDFKALDCRPERT